MNILFLTFHHISITFTLRVSNLKRIELIILKFDLMHLPSKCAV